MAAFEVVDNDPPNVIVRTRTSFTETDEFAVAVTDVDNYNFKNFDNPNTYLSKFKNSISNDNPSGWAKGLVDAIGATNGNQYGQANCFIMNSVSTKVPANSNRQSEANVIDVKSIADGGTPDWDNGYVIYIPEKSRTIFSVQAVDNISDGGTFQMKLSTTGSGNLTWNAELIGTGKASQKSENIKNSLEASDDPANPGVVVNLFASFQTPTNKGETATLNITVTDKSKNKRIIKLPIKIVNTYFKRKRLDLEKRRLKN